ncbi:Alpha/Beta hydrolase protein [Limtongia smithiae]|uniref:Alpha/Beta hydrolase protein n=1 Tax=Limtongia smithiae TaxID=1125753 RepID=UPI0034CD6A81
MRSYLFDPAPLPSKKGSSAGSIDEAEDYDYADLDGVAKEYAPMPSLDEKAAIDVDENPLRRAARIVWRSIVAAAVFVARRVLSMSRKQQIILLASTIVVAIVLGFTLGYLTPDDEETPYPASYYGHTYGQMPTHYEVTDSNSDDVEAAAFVAEINSDEPTPMELVAQPEEEQMVSTTGFFGGLFGLGSVFGSGLASTHYTISKYQLMHFQELSLVNNIAYCVPSPGIMPPFNCTRACEFFRPGVEIVTTFTNTEADTSCSGYIAIDHREFTKRIMIVFRGTNSMTNWMTNLDTIQEPYPVAGAISISSSLPRCAGCFVHRGFMRSYIETKIYIAPFIQNLTAQYPEYPLLVTGHSLGGAIAVLAGADLITQGYTPEILTYGQPRVGNRHFSDWYDYIVAISGVSSLRITHKSDPVPRVPLGIEWYHASGEIYIAKGPLEPSAEDCYICDGQEDSMCSSGEGVVTTLAFQGREVAYQAHVEYFSRIGLCRFQL